MCKDILEQCESYMIHGSVGWRLNSQHRTILVIAILFTHNIVSSVVRTASRLFIFEIDCLLGYEEM